MCGIAGFYGKGNKEILEKMTTVLFHRGPDEQGFYFEKDLPLFFGHRRLVIRDKAGGRQPMRSRDDRVVTVYNGEIYNASELRQELETKGHVFSSSHSDTEVLLYAYREWGDAFVHKLNGMWAFAILDREKKKILLSRDRFGEKPLYYTLQNGVFAFASEIKALRQHPDIRFNISVKGQQKYHAYGYFPMDQTLYSGVHKLPGGCNLVLDLRDLSCRVTRYWSYKIEPDDSIREKDAIERLRPLLKDAVQRRLVSDVPVGIFLSGGLDSSAIAAFAAERTEGRFFNSFSVGFSEPGFDETPYARQVSAHLGTKHSSTVFSEDLFGPLRKEMFALLDEPLSDSSLFSYFLLCRSASKTATVALGGDAGDELFAGYDTYLALRYARWMQRLLPKPCHQAILYAVARAPLTHSYMPMRFKLERLLKVSGRPEPLWNPLWLGPLSPDEIAQVTGTPVKLEDLYSEAIGIWDKNPSKALVDKALEFYGNLFLQDQILVKVDRMSMMHSMEVRTPLLDIDLINYVRTVPWSLKLKGRRTKYIFKKAMEPLLPKDIVWRKKVGFSAPLGKWLAGGAVDYRPGKCWNARTRGFLQERMDAHRSLREDNRLLLWNTYIMDGCLNENGEYAVSP